MVLEVAPVESSAMITRDGVRLDADVYRPGGDGRWPVLLLRQAYGRRVASTVAYAHPRWYAAQGYVVVVQDVRGRGTSQGRFETLEHEAEDGAETIDWCANLPGTTGAVGMYGFSYQGMVQLLAAALAGPALKAVAPAMIGWTLHGDMLWEGGALTLASTMGWAAQVGADTARHQGAYDPYAELRAAASALPLGGPITARPEVIERLADWHHYGRWIDAPEDDAMWDRIAPARRLSAILARKLPMLFVGGWFDSTLPGTLAAWRAIATVQPEITRLLVGPWAHLPWARTLGGVDFGPEAVSPVDHAQIAWFNRWLKGTSSGSDPAIRLFDLGRKTWRESTDWRGGERHFFLRGDGLASIDPESGRLSDAVGEASEDMLVHDPWRPAPTCGGRYGSTPGPADRAEIDARGDVLTFTSAPLTAPLTISGRVRAVLHARADTPSFDLVATVSRMIPDGRVQGIAEGIRRVDTSAGKAAIEVDCLSTCITLLPGERLRLSIAAASFPAYDVNPGVGEPVETPQMEARIITIAVRHGSDHPSALIVEIAE